MSLLIVPRINTFFSSKRKNTSLLTGYITRTFDNSFINKENNFLVLHLEKQPDELPEEKFLDKRNALSVVQLVNNNFEPVKYDYLKTVNFNNSFILESVLYPDGEEIDSGNVFIPFHSSGYSENIIIYIRYNDNEYMTVFISKLQKEPYVFEGRKNYDNIWEK